MRTAIVHTFLLPLSLGALAAQAPLRESVQRYRQANEARIVRELADLVAIPNLASDAENIRRNARHFGRSASDDKAAIGARLAARDAQRASDVKPSVNLKFFFEREEEAESK